MHSERVGKSTGALRKTTMEQGRYVEEFHKQSPTQVFFSNNPGADKYSVGKAKAPENNPVKERHTTMAEFRPSPRAAEKSPNQGNLDYNSLAKKFFDTTSQRQMTMQSPIKQLPQPQESTRSYKLLNQFLQCKENDSESYRGKTFQPQYGKDKERKPQFSHYVNKVLHQYDTDRHARDTSMMSAKSQELMDHLQKSANNLKTYKQDLPESIPKNKTLTSFTKLFEQSKTCREIGSPFFMIEPKADGKGSTKTGYGNPVTPVRSPNDSYIMMNNCDRSYVNQAGNASPAHSAIRFRQTDRSKISALNRSDMSKASNNNSFLTRRGDENDFSRVCAQQGDSNNRGGMSKTWVKSGLLDSREENLSNVSSKVS